MFNRTLLACACLFYLGLMPSALLCAEENPVTPVAPVAPQSNYDFDACLNRNKKLPDYQKFHELVKGKADVMWVITGDSITHGCLHTLGGRNYPEHWIELIRFNKGRTQDGIVNTGISGDTIVKRDGRDRGLLETFDRRITRYAPQIVSINLGMNDCTDGPEKVEAFRKNMTEAVNRVRKLNAIPILHIPNPTQAKPSDKRLENLNLYSQVLREVADKEKVLLVDHQTHWNHFTEDPIVRKKWMNDQVHPNAIGQAEMFKKMAWDLGLFDPNVFTCQLGDKTIPLK